MRIEYANFEKTVSILAELIRDALPELTKQNIDIIDRSNRQGFRGDWPFWSYSFTKRLRNEPVVLQVSFTLAVDFDESEICRTCLRSETFQIMQESRWQDILEDQIRVCEILEQGLSTVVLRNINYGKEHAFSS